jgi:hypothetical protein
LGLFIIAPDMNLLYISEKCIKNRPKREITLEQHRFYERFIKDNNYHSLFFGRFYFGADMN